MGRKQQKIIRKLMQEASYEKTLDNGKDNENPRQSAKQLSKRNKKNKKCTKKHQISITKEHRWYLIKVYDTTPPTKAFLQESFSSLVDTELTMLGFHHSTSSTRFYLENNSAAASALQSLSKRMQGSQGRLMHIQTEPCQSFLLLNAQQIAIVKQVLQSRFNAENSILDLTRFHHDPLFLEHNVLPVLWDPPIFKQILCIIRDNIPNLKGIVLSNNALKLSNVRVLAGTLGKCPIQGINLEHNEIENVKELINVLSLFPVVELKLEGNNCLKDIKNPIVYIKTVQSKLPELKTLDGVDIVSYLASKENEALTAGAASLMNAGPAPTAAPEVKVTEPTMQQFLKEYYLCIDTDQRLQLVNAYNPCATITIQSDVAEIPTATASGHDQIREVLRALPATNHARDEFQVEVINMEPIMGIVQVSGKLQVQGRAEVVSFIHRFTIMPYNSGLGCTLSVWSFK